MEETQQEQQEQQANEQISNDNTIDENDIAKANFLKKLADRKDPQQENIEAQKEEQQEQINRSSEQNQEEQSKQTQQQQLLPVYELVDIVPILHPQYQETSKFITIEASEDGRVSQFAYIKTWEEDRTQTVSMNRSIIDSIFKKIEQQIIVRKHQNDAILQFFKDRFTQESKSGQGFSESYQELSNINFVNQTVGCNQQNRNFDQQLHSAFVKLNFQTQEIYQKSKELAKFIENEILQGSLSKILKQIDDLVLLRTNQLFLKQKEVYKNGQWTKDKYEQYKSLFQSYMNSKQKSKQWNNDLYYLEIQYLQQAEKHFIHHYEYCNFVMSYNQELQNLDQQRLTEILNAMKQYLTKHKQIYQLPEDFEQKEQVIPLNVNKTVIQDGLVINEINYIQQQNNLQTSEEITIEQLISHFMNQQLKKITSYRLIDKLIDGLWFQVGVDKLNDFVPARILFTVDMHIVVLHTCTYKYYGKFNKQFYCNILESDFTQNEDDLTISIMQPKKSFLEKSKGIILKFLNQETFREFKENVYKIQEKNKST